MSALLSVKEQAVLISLLKREIDRIKAQELAFKIQTTPPYKYRVKSLPRVRKPTSEEIETKNICKKILDDVAECGVSQEKENRMEKHKLLKDLPNAKAGEIFTLCQRELANGGDETVLVGEWCEFCEEEIEKFDILNPDKGWFEKIEEKEYDGRVPKVGDIYWAICADGAPFETFWRGMNLDKDRFESGNAFWTHEEAEKELKRRKAYVILKEDTKGFKPDWKNGDEKKWYVLYRYNADSFILDWHAANNAGEKLHFATKEDAEASIKAHRRQWLNYLGIEAEA